jgi:predicted transcriptional regulator
MTVKEMILKTALYQSGQEFTSSDMAVRCQIKANTATKMIGELINENLIVRFERNNKPCYMKAPKHKLILNRKLASWTPPRPSSHQYASPWLNLGEL